VRAAYNRVRVMKVGLVSFREVATGPFEPIETQWNFSIHEPDGAHTKGGGDGA
jgi:hypothetical protein